MKRNRYQITTTLLITIVLGVIAPLGLAEQGPSDDIQAAVRSMGERPSWHAKAHLEKFSPEVTVPAIVAALQRDPAYRETPTRSLAYMVLFNIGAARFSEGLDQLISCLFEPQVPLECVRALALAPPENHGQVVQALGKILNNMQSPRSLIQEALQTLTRLPRSDVNAYAREQAEQPLFPERCGCV